jgi:anaerobic selenocysteine-containing dehydrogenase
MAKKNVTRREFIKTGMVCLTSVLTHGRARQGYCEADKIKGVSRSSLKSLQSIPTTCGMCPAGCGIMGFLDGTRLVQILGNPDHPNNKGSICTKGMTGMNLVNDPERLLFPMKRKGQRGERNWSRISWDEAYSTLAARLDKMITEKRMNELVVDRGQNDPLLDEFLSSLGTPVILDRQNLKNLTQRKAFSAMLGTPSLIEDVARSRTILNFGANPFANHDHYIGMAKRIVHAKVNNGAKLITFDVRMSETAAGSDRWYPVKSGSDGIIALAMAQVIVEEGLADTQFMQKNTNCSLQDIKEHLSTVTPEAAEKESGVKAKVLRQLAREFAAQGPSVAVIGGGITDQGNGFQGVRCVSLLNWLVGNIEKTGGLLFPRFPGKRMNQEEVPQSFSTDSSVYTGISDLLKTKSRIDTYFSYLSNPAFSTPDCRSTARHLQNEKAVSFLAVMDTHLTETAMLADLVLPAATYLEGWSLKNAPSLDGFPILNLQQPVVSLLSSAQALRSTDFDVGKLLQNTFKPKGEALEIGNFCLELSRRVGRNAIRSLPFKDTKDFVIQKLSQIEEADTKESLMTLQEKGLWAEESRIKKHSQNIQDKTSAGKKMKVKIRFEDKEKPEWSSYPEYHSLHSLMKSNENEFTLTPFKTGLLSERNPNSKWAREIQHENRLWINKQAAEKIDIKNGDKVQVKSSAGSFVTRVITTQRIHPRSVAIAEGFGHSGVGKVAKSKKFKSLDTDTEHLWWEEDGNGANPHEIIENRKDPHSGATALKNTIVRLEKI